MLFISSKTSFSQCVLGLPIGPLDMGFHLLIFCTILSSAMRSTWPNQFNLCFFNNPNYILYHFVDFSISFNPSLAIICSCRTKYFSRALSFKNHQFICHIFLKHPCFGSVKLLLGELTCYKVVVWRFGTLILMKIVFLWTWCALFPAAILSLISSSIELSVFTVFLNI